jgi:adenylate kinase family enzyme
MVIVNLLGAPGVGKSTFATGLFSAMKIAGYSVEYVDEYAKAKVYEKNDKALKCQPYIFANQLYKIESIRGNCDYIVNDSPIVLSAAYNQTYPESFNRAVIDIHNTFDSRNIFLKLDPTRTYVKSGRIHDLEQSLEIERKIVSLLEDNDIPYIPINQYQVTFQEIFKYL